MNKRTVRAIIRKGSSFLLARRKKSDTGGGMWHFIGGGIDDQKPRAAMRRELKEEANLTALSMKKMFLNTNRFKTRTIFYDVKVAGKPKYQRKELSALGYFSYKQAMRLPLTETTIKILRKVASKEKYPLQSTARQLDYGQKKAGRILR